MIEFGTFTRWVLTIVAVIAWIVLVPLVDALVEVGRKAGLRRIDLGGPQPSRPGHKEATQAV